MKIISDSMPLRLGCTCRNRIYKLFAFPSPNDENETSASIRLPFVAAELLSLLSALKAGRSVGPPLVLLDFLTAWKTEPRQLVL